MGSVKEYVWNDDLRMSDVSEQYILKEYLQKIYPLAVKKDGYNKEFDYVVPELDCTVELKTDIESNTTSNLFIEFECNDKPSGIVTTTAAFWLISDGIVIFRFENEEVQGFYNNRITDENPNGEYRVAACESDNPTLGVIVPQPYNNYFDHIVHEIPQDTYGHLMYLKKFDNN